MLLHLFALPHCILICRAAILLYSFALFRIIFMFQSQKYFRQVSDIDAKAHTICL